MLNVLKVFKSLRNGDYLRLGRGVLDHRGGVCPHAPFSFASTERASLINLNGKEEMVSRQRSLEGHANVTPYGSSHVLAEFTVRAQVQFHCHDLEREDMAMMANFTVV